MRTALKALIEDKKKGHKPAKVAAPEDTNVIDLMAALRASLEGRGRPSHTKPAAKPAAAHKAASSKAKPKSRKAS